jgi:hypothetical protein
VALKLHNRPFYPAIFLIGCIASIVIWLLFAGGHRPELLISAIGGVAGFSYFQYKQHLDETKLFRELFADFNSRYDGLNDHLNAIRSGASEISLTAREQDYLFSYFNLCAEEHLFFGAGYIDRRVWKSWCKGMEIFFGCPRIRMLWEEEVKSGSYYGFRGPR